MTPKTRWTLAIVGLLGGNVLAMTTLATVANVGHSEVIPDYYDQSTRYDDKMAAATASRALGWRVEATLVDGALSVAVRDAAGAPLAGATVRAAGYPRSHAHERFDVPLVARGPGTYLGVADRLPGLHDLAITIERGGQHDLQHLLIEAP